MKRTSDLYNVEPRSALVVFKDKPGNGRDDVDCLHIVRRQGYYDRGNNTGIPELVTNCNRVIEHTSTLRRDEIPESPYVKLCPRCGTRQDFERALLEQQAAATKARQGWLEEQERRRAEFDRAWEAALDAMEEFHWLVEKAASLIETGHEIKTSFDREDGTFIIQIDDVTLELTQTERKLDNGETDRITKTKKEVHKAEARQG